MDVFKVPKVPPTTLKRKLSDSISPENAKRHKPSPLEFLQSSASSSILSKRKATVSVEEAPEEDDTIDEEPENEQEEFAPNNDADHFILEDDEARFFGSGLSKEQKDILNIFEDAEGEPAGLEDLTLPAIRRLLLKLERANNKNQDQRSKYPDDPTKFIDSEADLDNAIKSLMPLSQVPALAYPELVKSETIGMLIGLLSHENIDIVIDVVELIHELTDEDVGSEDEEEDNDDGKGRDAGMKMLVEALTKHSILELLVQNFGRFNEEEESDRQGLFHVLAIFENMLALKPELSTVIVSKTSFLTWLLTRMQAKVHDENRGYAAELLAILLQNNRDNRMAFAKENGMEVLLNVLANYRNRDPETADEEEFMENAIDSLCSALQEPENKTSFDEGEGVDLMLIIMRGKSSAGKGAIKVLDSALSGPSGSKNCVDFVEALGLKALFSLFMGKSKKKSNTTAPASEETSHMLGIISSLLSNLGSETPERLRLLTKFVESSYEKVDRLLDIREGAELRLKVTEKEIESENRELLREGSDLEDMQELWYLRRLEGGLYTLQIVDYILGWICMEDDGVREHVVSMLNRRDKSLKDIVDVLRVYRDNVEVDEDAMQEDDSTSQREILNGLLAFLETC